MENMSGFGRFLKKALCRCTVEHIRGATKKVGV